jgi:ubiquinone/menaquinone biosynthesis C-methylase UbiE
MTNSNTQEIAQRKQWFAKLFDRVAPTYDQVGPKFFDYFGRRLVELAQIPKGASVLDVATGRGAILFPAAEAVGPQGHVIGIDLSEAMVQETSVEIKQRGLKNAEVRYMDAEYLQFPDASLDYVLCGLSIFFFPQLERALSEMRRVLKSGGVIGVTTFWRDDERWNWLGELFDKYLPQVPEDETTTEEEKPPGPDFRSHEGMEAVMNAAGFTNIQIVGEEPDFVYGNEEEWWSTVWSHGMRARLERIESTAGSDALQQFMADAFKKLQTNKQSDGFHHMWSVLFTLAKKLQE